MSNYKKDRIHMNEIISKTIKSLDMGKKEIIEIAENSRKECKRLEDELHMLKQQVYDIITEIDKLEHVLNTSKKKLFDVNTNYGKSSEQELVKAYQTADNILVQLTVKREQERYLIKRRNDLEIRIRDSMKTLERADTLVGHVSVALGYLGSDIKGIGDQLDDLQQKQYLGIRIIEAQEEERKRVAREIHDGPAQSMSNIVIKAEICDRLLDKNIENAKMELKNLKNITRQSLQEVRKIIYNLRPMALDDLGLLPTLERYVSSFKETTGIDVALNPRNIIDELKPVISLTVFRIVQEALNNILKHSKSSSAYIFLEGLEKNLSIIIIDKGIGFDTKSIKMNDSESSGGFGLFSMKERVALLNGEFDVISEEGKGTRINILIPLIDEEEVLDSD